MNNAVQRMFEVLDPVKESAVIGTGAIVGLVAGLDPVAERNRFVPDRIGLHGVEFAIGIVSAFLLRFCCEGINAGLVSFSVESDTIASQKIAEVAVIVRKQPGQRSLDVT